MGEITNELSVGVFLLEFAVAILLSIALSAIWREWMRRIADARDTSFRLLDQYERAWLQSGRNIAIERAVLNLLRKGNLILDPNDTSNPLLYDPTTGAPRASVLQATPNGGWLGDQVYENAIESWKDTLTPGSAVKIDGLLYTNNAIFGIVHRSDVMDGQLIINGSLVCSDLGLLAPGKQSSGTQGTDANLPGSPYKIGLRLNYDERTKAMLNVQNPNQVTMRRALVTPSAN